MKTSKYKCIESVFHQWDYKQIPTELITIILAYINYSKSNDQLRYKKYTRCLRIKNVDLDWNLFANQVRCKHNNNNKIAGNKNKMTFNANFKTCEVFFGNYFNPTDDNMGHFIGKKYKYKFDPLDKEGFLSQSYRRSVGYYFANHWHPTYHYSCQYSITIPCQICGERYRFGYNPNMIIHDCVAYIPLEYSGLVIIVL